MKFQQDFSDRASFKTLLYHEDYWVDLLETSEYKKIALKALQQLVVMPNKYMSGKGFCCLVKLTTKK